MAAFTAISVESGRMDTVPPNERESASEMCAAWRAEKTRVDAAARELPDGWYWNTTGARTPIVAFTAAVGRQLDAFEQRIGATPDEVSRAAHAYVLAKRAELSALKSQTYNQDVGAAVSSARGKLTSLCQ